MSRPNKIWFRKDRNTWYVRIGGKLHNLGSSKEEAERRFYQLKAAGPGATLNTASLTVAELLDRYLAWCKANRAPRTFDWYSMMLQSFLDSIYNLPIDQLKPFHINEWAEKKPAKSTQRGAMAAVQRAFNWAAQQGYIDNSPIAHLRKPMAERREAYPTQAEYEQILGLATEPFKSILQFLYESGCRPQEAIHIEPDFIRGDRVIFPVRKSKGKKYATVIHLTEKAKRLLGNGFKNARGRKWTCAALDCRMKKIAKRTGKKFCCYSIRHLFATRMLEAGLDHLTVAKLMNHRDASMLSRHYAHIGEKNNYLLDSLRRVN